MKIRKHAFQNDKAWLNPPPSSFNKQSIIHWRTPCIACIPKLGIVDLHESFVLLLNHC
jgi:hypothetical protein